MSVSKKHKNPYANPDGTPIDGKEPEFFAWGREAELDRREDLPKSQKKTTEESDHALADRMNS